MTAGHFAIILEGAVDRLHHQVAVDSKDPVHQLGAEPVHDRHDVLISVATAQQIADEGDRSRSTEVRVSLRRVAQISPRPPCARKPEVGTGAGWVSARARFPTAGSSGPTAVAITASGESVSRSPVALFLISTSFAATPRGRTIIWNGRPIRSAGGELAPCPLWSVSS